MKILHFEDSDLQKIIVEAIIKRAFPEAELRQENNALFSLSEIASFDPDIIIADLNLPIRDFDYYVKKVKAEGKPIIIYTGCDKAEATCRIKEALGEIPEDLIFCYKCDSTDAIERAINKLKGTK